MYCGQCGKKINENMLFCPFCGAPVVIPDQPDAEAAAGAPTIEATPATLEPTPTAEPVRANPARTDARPVSLFDAPPPRPAAEGFVPLSFEDEAVPEPAPAEVPPAAEPPAQSEASPAAEPEDIPEALPEPPRRAARNTRLPERAVKRAANTYIPLKDLDPEDLFLSNDADAEADDYDVDEALRTPKFSDDEFEFEERERGGFFQRHVRGIVGLLLLAVVLVVCAVWAFSPKGQLTLARLNLAWTAKPYAELGYDAYQQNSDLLAAGYYEKALARDNQNYEYAHSAMVAYYEADQIDRAAEMLKTCVALQPTNPEPYQELMILYPDAASRPLEIKELIRQGYERTGDAALGAADGGAANANAPVGETPNGSSGGAAPTAGTILPSVG